MMALGHELGADDDIDPALGNFVQLAAHGLDRGDEIARQHHGSRIRKKLGGFLLQPFDTWTDRNQRLLRRAIRARVRTRHREAAVMTDESLPETMIDQPGIADRAGEAMPAGPA